MDWQPEPDPSDFFFARRERLMVGRDAEWSGIIRSGPRWSPPSLIPSSPRFRHRRRILGAGKLRPCAAKAYDRAHFRVPTAASRHERDWRRRATRRDFASASWRPAGKQLSDEEKQELVASIKATYEARPIARVCRGAPVGRCHHRPGPDPRRSAAGAGGRLPLNPDVPRSIRAYSRRNRARQFGLFFILLFGGVS